MNNKNNTITEMQKAVKPAPGVCYLYNSANGAELIRLVREKSPSLWETEIYSFAGKCWTPNRAIGESTLKEYYKAVVCNINRALENEVRIGCGQPLLFPDAGSQKLLSDNSAADFDSDTALATLSSSSDLEAIRQETEMLRYHAELVRDLAKCRVDEMRRSLMDSNNPINIALRQLNVQLDVLTKTVDILKVYLGEGVKLSVVSEGQKAGADVPVTIRQRILFMDEEMAVIGDDGKGLDHNDIHLFVDWLKEPSHRDIIVPEEKCVVVMKPRRFGKAYTSDWRENERLNYWNFHSFIVIRNGENVQIVESDDLCIYDTAIPKKDAIEVINADKWHTDERKEDLVRNLGYRAMLLAQVIQGIADRTDFFSPSGKISIKENQGVAFVFDDDKDFMVGTGIRPFRDWLKDVNKTIRRGSRIIYINALGGGDYSRYYTNDFSKPEPPSNGLYSVDSVDNGRAEFLYHPYDRFTHENRERQERWRAYAGSVINYDAITAEEIEAYLSDRTQRTSYESIIPILVTFKKQKEHEQQNEKLFRDCIKRDPLLKRQPTDAELDEAIEWWKQKTVFIRALSVDDKKSYRMILKYVILSRL